MSKFKIGDKVRVIEKLAGDSVFMPVGHCSEIISASGSYVYPYRIRNDKGNGELVAEEQLELVVDPTFTKADLKTGMVVTYRRGDERTFVETNRGDFLDGRGMSCATLESFNEDLTSTFIISNAMDIMAVHSHGDHFIPCGDSELLWERKEPQAAPKPQPKKLTVGEIQEHLGYEIEVVAG